MFRRTDWAESQSRQNLMKIRGLTGYQRLPWDGSADPQVDNPGDLWMLCVGDGHGGCGSSDVTAGLTGALSI